MSTLNLSKRAKFKNQNGCLQKILHILITLKEHGVLVCAGRWLLSSRHPQAAPGGPGQSKGRSGLAPQAWGGAGRDVLAGALPGRVAQGQPPGCSAASAEESDRFKPLWSLPSVAAERLTYRVCTDFASSWLEDHQNRTPT